MATIDSLANETLCKIMGMLKNPLPGWDDEADSLLGRYDALRAAALVCSRWRDPAQRALFDEVQVCALYQNRIQQLLATPRPPRHRTRALRQASQCLGISADTEHLRTILDAFPSPATLTHLSFGTDDFSSLEHIIPILGHPTLALLTKLDFPSLLASAPIERASAVAAMAKACEDRGVQWSMGV
ncbi:hypothetical protein RQP46_003213 [Phenoliferia psychrophenolica]